MNLNTSTLKIRIYVHQRWKYFQNFQKSFFLLQVNSSKPELVLLWLFLTFVYSLYDTVYIYSCYYTVSQWEDEKNVVHVHVDPTILTHVILVSTTSPITCPSSITLSTMWGYNMIVTTPTRVRDLPIIVLITLLVCWVFIFVLDNLIVLCVCYLL